MTGVKARLGHVFYWLGSALAILLICVAVWILVDTGDRQPGFIAFVFAPAPIAWLTGLAVRYILSGYAKSTH